MTPTHQHDYDRIGMWLHDQPSVTPSVLHALLAMGNLDALRHALSHPNAPTLAQALPNLWSLVSPVTFPDHDRAALLDIIIQAHRAEPHVFDTSQQRVTSFVTRLLQHPDRATWTQIQDSHVLPTFVSTTLVCFLINRTKPYTPVEQQIFTDALRAVPTAPDRDKALMFLSQAWTEHQHALAVALLFHLHTIDQVGLRHIYGPPDSWQHNLTQRLSSAHGRLALHHDLHRNGLDARLFAMQPDAIADLLVGRGSVHP